jgi:hypothetical protein
MNRTGMTVKMALQGQHITPDFELTGNLRDLANLIAALERIPGPTEESNRILGDLWRLMKACGTREE